MILRTLITKSVSISSPNSWRIVSNAAAKLASSFEGNFCGVFVAVAHGYALGLETQLRHSPSRLR